MNPLPLPLPQSITPSPVQLYIPELTPESTTPPSKPKLPTLRRVWNRHLLPSLQARNRSKKTIEDIALHLSRWEEYWKSKRIGYPLAPSKLKRSNLEEWQNALLATGLSKRTVNKHLASIRQILVCAEKHALLDRRPRLEQLPHAKAAAKLYMTDEQLDRLWVACDSIVWPPSSISRVDPPTFWRSALILYRTYAFRTQELVAYEKAKQSLTWANVSLASQTPNPAGTAENPHGWLWYVPEKQAWAKPEPLFLPLTRHARAAIDRLAAVAGDGNEKQCQPLLPIPHAPRSFYRTWNSLLAIAEVKPKQMPGASVEIAFEPKALRKTAATMLNRHHHGLAEAVGGWAKRDGQESAVAATHYIADELTLVDKLNSAPMPSSFDAWL